MRIQSVKIKRKSWCFGVLRKVIRAEKMADGRVPLTTRSGYIFENWGTILGKSSRGRVYLPFFGHDRVKVGVDQSAVCVSRCNKVGTLLCRFLTRVYPVVSFTLIYRFLSIIFLSMHTTSDRIGIRGVYYWVLVEARSVNEENTHIICLIYYEVFRNYLSLTFNTEGLLMGININASTTPYVGMQSGPCYQK